MFGVVWSMKPKLLILASLFLFGLAYNWLFNRSRPRYTEPYTAEWVVVGTAVTLGGAALAEPFPPGWVMVCFAASGLPMAAGDAERFVRKFARLLHWRQG